MSKPRVLFRVGNMRGGGAEKVLIRFLNNFDRTKMDAGVLMHQYLGVYADKIPSDVKTYYLEKGPEFINAKGIWRKVVKEFQKNKGKFLKSRPSIIYSSFIKEEYDIEVAFLHDIIPYTVQSPVKSKIGWIRTDLTAIDYVSDSYKKEIVKASFKCDKIICVSNDAKDKFLSIGANPKNIEVLYNPIDTKGIIEKSKEGNHQFNNKLINIIAIGRLTKAKRYDRLIDATYILVEEGLKDFCIHIVGQGELEDDLNKKIKEQNLSEYIKLHGFKSNPYPMLNAADIYIMTSEREGLPGTICEAMTLQKPIISTKVGGAVELLRDGELGLLIDSDPKNIAQALESFLSNKVLREKYSNKLKNTEIPFDFDTVIKKMTDTILEVL